MSSFQPVAFKLDGEFYGLDIRVVNAIEREQSIIRVPNSSNSIKGIINLRGEIIPVVDLRAKFNLPRANSDISTELVVVNLDKYKIALEVDNVEEIHSIDDENIVPMPIIAIGKGVDYFERIAKSDGKIIILINAAKLLNEEEASAIEKITAENAEN